MQHFHFLQATLLACCFGLATPLQAEKAATGFQPEKRIQQPTRLGWAFVLSSSGAEAPPLAPSYDSARQRYQLFVPSDYDPARTWPLVVFLSPGDDPLGWQHWQKACEAGHLCFCAAYGAGASTNPSTRTRIVLDMFDDVRRHYRIDPDQTYLTGFSSGASLACTLAFALPEYFGGVVLVGGGGELNQLEYLRVRVRDRLSVALVTGPADFKRRELEEYHLPHFTDLGMRTRLWRVPGLGHAMPGPEVLREAVTWLAEDLPRRRADAGRWPLLSVAPDEVATDRTHAARMLETAEAELNHPEKILHGVALLDGILARYERTDSADKAAKHCKEIQADPRRRQWLREQRALEEKRTVTARARALERAGDLRGAFQAWGDLAAARVGTADGTQAAREMGRLKTLLDAMPYLGLHLEGESATVERILARGPAERAGLRGGDRLLKLGQTPISSLADLRQALQTLKPGDRVAVTVQRGQQKQTINLEIGRPPG